MRADVITQTLGFMVGEDMMPLNVMNGEGFSELLNRHYYHITNVLLEFLKQ